MDDDVIIKVEHVNKTFRLPHEKQSSVKGLLISALHGGKRNYEKQQALKDISFEVKRGEFFGIVGRNGSGKSTLLKLLAGIYTPTKGTIQINGKLTPFIELGVGFSPELTGRENVYLNGALLGFNRAEMAAMYDDIVEFAELERFMDQKLKNYSSGMQVRLAFSIAIRAKSDILLIDEVLAVGDASFQQKCYEVFSNLKEQGRTIILVTHDMSAVSRFCDRAILILDGLIEESGVPKDIADSYLELNYENGEVQPEEGATQNLCFTNIAVNGKHTGHATINSGTLTKLTLAFSNVKNKELQFGVQIFNEAGNYCFGTNTRVSGIAGTTLNEGVVELDLNVDLVQGNYTITTAIMNSDATRVLVYKPRAAAFRVTQTNEIEGVANLKHSWKEARHV